MGQVKKLIIIVMYFVFIMALPVRAEETDSDMVLQDEMDKSGTSVATVQQAQETELKLTIKYPDQIKCGEPVTFTLNADGGTGNYNYRIHTLAIYDGAEWVSVYDVSYGSNSAYKESNEFTFTFYASGLYEIRFSVMDMGSPSHQTVSTGLFENQINIQDADYPSVEQIVDEVAAQCMKECTSEFEKAVWLHDWILDHAEYDYSYTYCSAEGVLARGVGTCESYHRAYVMLLNKVGIQTGRIKGNGHVWTAVKMDGEWYQIDSTWDDMGSQYKGTYYEHMYFGLTDYIIGLVHSDHKSAVQGYESASLENNYFIKTGEIRQWSDPFIELIKRNIAEGKSEFTLPVTAAMPDNYKNVIYNLVAYQLSKQNWDGVKVSASYLNTDNVIMIETRDIIDELQSLSIVPPTKVVYKKGETTDTSGLTVTAVYASGSKVLGESEYTVEGFNTDTVGERTATVVYGGKSAVFTYSVKEEQKPSVGSSKGWQGDGDKRYYVMPNGTTHTGWLSFGKTYYYCGKDGYILYGKQKIGGNWYYFNEAGVRQQNKWIEENGKKKYYALSDGKLRTGWLSFGKTYYYCGKDGYILYGKQKIEGNWYYFNEAGIRQQNKWIEENGEKKYYALSDGKLRTGWLSFGSTYYYCESSGAIVKDRTCNINGVCYYFNDKGIRQKLPTGWKTIDNKKKCYVMPDGTIHTGWLSFGKTYYYCGKDGLILYGKQKIGGNYYYFNNVGVRQQNKWIEENGTKMYYALPDGKLRVGWLSFGSTYYYCRSDASIVKGQTYKIDGVNYYFNAQGIRQK